MLFARRPSRLSCPVLRPAGPLVVLIVATLASPATPAEEQDARTLPKIQVEEAVEDTLGYNATRAAGGTKTDTPLVEIPQSISVITFEQIRDQNAQNMQEVLRYSAGVRAEMYGLDNRGDWFTLRGGSEGATLLDGLRLPLSGYYGNVRNEPYAFERIEVLRGPSSVIAGQNGPGGVVNLVSKQPKADPRREISVQVGNFEHRQVAVDFTGPLNDGASALYRLVALAKDSDTQVSFAEDERQYFAPSFTWLPDAHSSLTVYAQYQRDESTNHVGFFPWTGMLLPAPNGQIPVDTFIGEPDWDTYGGERIRAGYNFARQLSDAWSVRHNLRYESVDGQIRGMYANFWEGFLPDQRSLNRTWYASQTDTYITNTEVLAEGALNLGGLEHTVLVGADALWLHDNNLATGGPAPALDVYAPTYGVFALPPFAFGPDNPVRTRQLGLLIQDQVRLNERWVLVGSLRHDSGRIEPAADPQAGADEDAWTSRAGVVYLAPGGWAPYASYSESFELVTGTDINNAPFRPKRGEQLEAGVKWEPVANALVTVAAYTLREENRLAPDPTNRNFSVQRGEVRVEGFELDATAALASWDFVGNYTYTDARVSSTTPDEIRYLDKQLTSIPEHAASLWAVHRFNLMGIPGFRLGAGVRYVGETFDGTDTLETPSNTLIDALLSFESGGWRYAVNATNLTDRIYLATCLERGDCWYGSRREITATASYRW